MSGLDASERAQLANLLEHAGVEPRIIDSLALFGALLLDTNRRFNVSGPETPQALMPHILDSLSIAPYVEESFIDIGSGGGLPAVPLAIATGIPVTLVESTTKKAAFLESVLAQLGLDGRVIPERAELAGRHSDLRDRFPSATGRAVSSAATVLELTMPFVRVDGIAALQRGKMTDRERDAVIDAAPMLGARLENEVRLPGNRRLLLVRKIAATPQRFPRRTGVAGKRPLCL